MNRFAMHAGPYAASPHRGAVIDLVLTYELYRKPEFQSGFLARVKALNVDIDGGKQSPVSFKPFEWDVIYLLATSYWLGRSVASTDAAIVSGMSEASARRSIRRLTAFGVISVNQDGIDRRRRLLSLNSELLEFLENFVSKCGGEFSEIITFHETQAREVAERRLRASESQRLETEMRLQTVDSLVDTGQWSRNLKTGEHIWSDGVYRMFGFKPSEVTVSRDLARSMIHPDDVDAYVESIGNLVGKGALHRVEFRIVLRDGTQKWLREGAALITDDHGQASQIVGILRDISLNVETQLALEESEQRFRDYTETASDWVWETDEMHRVVFISDRYFEIFDRPRRAIIGKTRYETVAAMNSALDQEMWTQHQGDLDARRAFRDFRYRSIMPHGRVVWFSVSGKPVFDGDGNFVGYRGTGRDISVEAEAVAKLEESEARWRALVDQQHDMVAFYGSDLGLRYANTAFYKFRGLREDEIGNHEAGDCLAPDDVEACRRVMKGLSADNPSVVATYRMRRNDRHWRWVEWQHKAVVGDDGDLLGIICSGRDITNQHEKASKLLRDKRQAETASRLKSAYLAAMSHDLRTPLNAILGFSQLMQSEVAGPLGAPRYGEYLNYITDSGNYLLSLVDNVLDLAKIEADEMALEEEPVGILELLEYVCRTMTPSAAQAGIDIVVGSDSPEVRFRADPMRLVQMVSNLVSNAVKYSRSGDVVEVSFQDGPNGTGVIGVRDTGTGMPPESLETIFEPFRQMPMELSRKQQGAGLGLAIVKSMADLHGAELEIQSELGVGTHVEIILPKARRVSSTAKKG